MKIFHKFFAVFLLFITVFAAGCMRPAKSGLDFYTEAETEGKVTVPETTEQESGVIKIYYGTVAPAQANAAVQERLRALQAAFWREAALYTPAQGEKPALEVRYLQKDEKYGLQSNLILVKESMPDYAKPILTINTTVTDAAGTEIGVDALFMEGVLPSVREVVQEVARQQGVGEEALADAFGDDWADYSRYCFSAGTITFYSNRLLAKNIYPAVSVPLSKASKLMRHEQIKGPRPTPVPTETLGPTATPGPSATPTPTPTPGEAGASTPTKGPTPTTPAPTNRPTVIPGTNPMIALTFDDGPYSNNNATILAALQKYNARATFFVLGDRIKKHETALKNVVAAGSEVGNHSYSHANLAKGDLSKLKYEVEETQRLILEVTGVPSRLFRPPYGAFDDRLKQNCGLPMIMWTVDTRDWAERDTDKLIQYVLSTVKDGDIVLMHENLPTTAAALDAILSALTSEGYQMVTVSELLSARGPLENGKIYRKR